AERPEGEKEMVVKDAEQGHADDFERLTNLAEEYGDAWESSYEAGESYRVNRSGEGERDAKMDAMANTAGRAQSLSDQLLDQWRMVETTPEVRQAGEYLIGFIDDDGYLRTDMATLLAQAPPGFTMELLEKALKVVQSSLEPVGLGARDIRECLLLQIDARARQTDPDNGECPD